MAEAERQEAQHGPPEELPFTATILCVGIAGTGKTATIHNLLGRPAPPNFAVGTKKVRCCLPRSLPACWPVPKKHTSNCYLQQDD